jgi:hypothetical protein
VRLLEDALVVIGAEIFGLDDVGVDDNSFASGGHSLSATRLISRGRDAFQVGVPPRCFFEALTVAAPMLASPQSRAAQAAHGEMGRVLMALEEISEVGAERFLASDSALGDRGTHDGRS